MNAVRWNIWILWVLLIALLNSCSPKTKIDAGFKPGIVISAAKSNFTSASTILLAGSSIELTVSLKDQNGSVYVPPSSTPVALTFSIQDGTSTGEFSNVRDNRNGTYSVTFTGHDAGSAITIIALINNKVLDSKISLQVVPGHFSFSNSYITLSSGSVTSGSTVTATLHVMDSTNNPITLGGLNVTFANSGGTSTAQFSSTLDNGDGTYSVNITGVTAGSATTLSANIFNSAVTSVAPTLTVTYGAPVKLTAASGNNQSAVVNSALSSSLSVLVQDANNNVVPSATVNWTKTGNSALYSSSSLSNASGLASNTLVVGTVSGNYTVTATINGTAISTNFTATATAAGVSSSTSTITASSTTLTTGDITILTATIKDSYGNPISGQTVSVSSTGTGNTIGQPLLPTNSNGQVTATLSSTVAEAKTISIAIPVALNGVTISVTYNIAAPGSFLISSVNVTTGNSLNVSFSSASLASSYTVKYGTSSGSYPTTASTSATSPYTITGLTANQTYYIMVVANNSSGSTNATIEAIGVPIDAFTMTSASPALSSAVVYASSVSGATTYDVLYDTVSRSASGSYSNISSSVSFPKTITSLSSGVTYYFRIRANNTYGSVVSTNELSTAVYQSFTFNIPFTAGTEGSYTLSDSITTEFIGGVARLKASSQTDSDNLTAGFGGATLSGVSWDSTNNYLRLNTITNNSEMDSDWVPQWNHLINYWKMNGSGSVSTSSFNVNKGSGTCIGPASGATYTSNGKINSGINLTASSMVTCTDSNVSSISNSITVGGWFLQNGGTAIAWEPMVSSLNFNVSPTIGWMLQRNNTTGLVFVRVDTSGQTNAVCGNVGALEGGWHHILFTIQSGAIHFYLDGRLRQTCSYTQGGGFASGINYTFKSLTNDGVSSYDDWGVWNTALTTAEVQALVSRQLSKYSGLAQSRVMNAFSSQNWTTLSALTQLPYYKEIPNTSSETSADYSSIVSNLTANLVSLWHFNEISYSGITNEVVDSFSNAIHGTSVGAITNNTLGKFNGDANFNGSNYIQVPDNANLDNTSKLTFSVWIYANTLDGSPRGIISKRVAANNNQSYSLFFYTGNKLAVDIDGASERVFSSTVFNTRQWYHIVVVYDGTLTAANRIKIYVNSILDTTGTEASSSIPNYTSDLFIGSMSAAYGNYFIGEIDEFAIWSRALSASEVVQLYRRGINQLKYQIRTCANSDCSDQTALTNAGQGWKGPDGTLKTYFSELYNTTNNILGGTVNLTSPVMHFANFGSLSVPTNQYFQYRTIFESDDISNVCNYGSGATSCSPELKSMSVGPIHYSPMQTVLSLTSIGTDFQTLNTNGFTDTLGSNLCTQGARYTLSSNGTLFYYWNGSIWTLSSDSYATASTATDISTNLSTFLATAGTGTLQVKTYLKSSGTTQCEIDNLQFSGKKY